MTQRSGALAAVDRGDAAAVSEETATVIPLTDRVLLERHVRGDGAAFAQLVRAYARPVYGYLTCCGVPATEREDLFQDVFEKVHRAVTRKLPPGPVRPWLFTITVNTVRDYIRKAKVRQIVRLDGAVAVEQADTEHGPAQLAEARETATFLADQLGKLPLPQREAVVLCCVQGLDLEQAAEAIGAPLDTVKTRLRRARGALSEAMARRRRVFEREVGR